MRFMIIVKATADSEAGVLPDESLFEEMAAYHEELARAGALIDGSGLHPTGRGRRVTWEGGRKSVTDGPFAETKELIAGYTLLRADSWEQAREWALKFPNPGMEDGRIELRQLYELEDFGEQPVLERFRAMGMK